MKIYKIFAMNILVYDFVFKCVNITECLDIVNWTLILYLWCLIEKWPEQIDLLAACCLLFTYYIQILYLCFLWIFKIDSARSCLAKRLHKLSAQFTHRNYCHLRIITILIRFLIFFIWYRCFVKNSSGL